MSEASSPYLEGMYAPQPDEITAHDLDVVAGEIPADLAGIFCQNSANPRFAPPGRHHWFDGDGMIHALEIDDCAATYRNRYVRTAGFETEAAAGHALWSGIMEPPDFSHAGGPYKNTANTDLIWHAGKLLALWWLGGDPYTVRLPSLETCGPESFDATRRSGLAAHPTVDPATGEMMFIDYGPAPPYLTYGVVGADGKVVHTEPIELPGYRLQHDIAITPNYSVLMDMSMMWDPEALAQGRVELDFFPDKATRFGLIPRLGSDADVAWFECEACFMYHVINAWEDDDTVVLQGCRMTRPVVGMADPDEELPAIGRLLIEPVLYEWTFDLAGGAVKERQLDDALLEFPRIDDRRIGRPTRYSYNQRVVRKPTLCFDGVTKYDSATGRSETHRYPDGHFGGETVFAPRAGSDAGAAEDDGYLLVFVADAAGAASEVHIIDAARPADEPVARLRIPQRVPVGYHTQWVPQAALADQVV